MYSIYLKLKVTFKKYVKQIYMNAHISNKLLNSDHIWLVCIVRYPTSVHAPGLRRCLGKVTVMHHMVILKLQFTSREYHSSFWLKTTLLMKSQWAYSQMETAVVALSLMILYLLCHTSRYKTDHNASIRTNTNAIRHWKQ